MPRLRAGSAAPAGARTSQSDEAPLDRIAFSSSRTGTAQIYVMNEDGSGQTRLTNSAPFDDMQPAWSPDGTRIVFTRGIDYQSANLGASIDRLGHDLEAIRPTSRDCG